MQPTRCLFSPSRALMRVFLPQLGAGAPVAAAASLSIRQTCLLPRLFSTGTARQRIAGAQSRSRADSRASQGKASSLLRKPTDNAIPFKWVILKNDDETLGEPQRKLDVLRTLDRGRYSLVMIAPPQKRAHEPRSKRQSTREALEDGEDDEAGAAAEEDPFTALRLDEPPTSSAPICQIMDRQVLRAEEASIAKEARRKELSRKELELNWAIAPHDLQHKLKQLKAFLEKGKKVEVMLARKRGGRQAQQEEADEALAALKEAAASVGARETKCTGQFPGVLRVVFEPRGDAANS